jgi:hypothetical protein
MDNDTNDTPKENETVEEYGLFSFCDDKFELYEMVRVYKRVEIEKRG